MPSSAIFVLPGGGYDEVIVREVWSHNLEHEVELISTISDDFTVVAVDTKSSGPAVRYLGGAADSFSQENYNNMRVNVNLLPGPIIVGLTLSDANGNLPSLPACSSGAAACPTTWQFNFCEFHPDAGPFNPTTIARLKSIGVDLAKNRAHGVHANNFAELLMASGVILNDSNTCVMFHGAYDVGLLVKLFTGRDLPEEEEEFLQLATTFFPKLYDVKHLMRFCPSHIYGGLNELGGKLGLERIGKGHQAGSDSLLTLKCFMELRERYLKDDIENHLGVLYGLGGQYARANPSHR